jgi:AAA domain-containing protein
MFLQGRRFILSSRDQAVNMRGAVGTGQTATLKELRRGLAEAGREVLALAPTMSAVEELQKIGFARAITAERTVALAQVQRQIGAVRGWIVRTRLRKSTACPRAGTAWWFALLTKRSSALQKQSEEDEGRSTRWANRTTAQKGDARNFRLGQILGFHRAIKGIARNEPLEVIRVEGERIIVRNESGREQTVHSRHAKSSAVIEQDRIHVGAGDRLLLMANRREQGFPIAGKAGV